MWLLVDDLRAGGASAAFLLGRASCPEAAPRVAPLAVHEHVFVLFSRPAPLRRGIPSSTLARYHDPRREITRACAAAEPRRAREAGGPLTARRLEDPFSS